MPTAERRLFTNTLESLRICEINSEISRNASWAIADETSYKPGPLQLGSLQNQRTYTHLNMLICLTTGGPNTISLTNQ